MFCVPMPLQLGSMTIPLIIKQRISVLFPFELKLSSTVIDISFFVTYFMHVTS